MEKILKETKYAKFIQLEDGAIGCILTSDFRDFDVDVNEYLHGTDEISENEYESIYMAVAEKCNESGEYTIDCFKGRYTVRKISEIEQIHYEAMSEEEKAEHDLNQTRYDLEVKLTKCENELKKLDYIGVKIATGRATIEEYSEQIAYMNTLAEQINDIKYHLSCL